MTPGSVARSLSFERSSGRLNDYEDARKAVVNLALAQGVCKREAKVSSVEEQPQSGNEWDEDVGQVNAMGKGGKGSYDYTRRKMNGDVEVEHWI